MASALSTETLEDTGPARGDGAYSWLAIITMPVAIRYTLSKGPRHRGGPPDSSSAPSLPRTG